jgi:hypothetical protein
MLKLDRPQYSAEDTFAACISRVRLPALKAKLIAATQAIRDASDAYMAAAEAQALDQIARAALVNGTVTTAEMEAVYTGRMAKQNAPGRAIYDDIFAAAKGRCPLCAHRTVTTLDHHLPKAHYPALAVAPLNLVPACSDCNKAKLANIPHAPEDVSIHPYFDDVADERWLYADVVQVTPASIRFRVEASAAWAPLLAERVRRHFRSLKLSSLYGSEAAEELLNIRHLLVGLHATGGEAHVRAYLEEHAESCLAGRLNGWRGAAYEAWAESDWFCNGGFAVVG